jgi:hypothetical protein
VQPAHALEQAAQDLALAGCGNSRGWWGEAAWRAVRTVRMMAMACLPWAIAAASLVPHSLRRHVTARSLGSRIRL